MNNKVKAILDEVIKELPTIKHLICIWENTEEVVWTSTPMKAEKFNYMLDKAKTTELIAGGKSK